MTLQNDLHALKVIAQAEAEAQSNATRAAMIAMMAEMLDLMRCKGLISDTDISALTKKLETNAGAMMGLTPQVGAALAETALLLHHALGSNTPINKQ